MFDKLPYHLGTYIFTMIPDEVILETIGISILLAVVFWRYRYFILLTGYSILIIFHTIVFRNTSDYALYILTPFHNFSNALEGDIGLFWGYALNIIMFVPIGILLPLHYKSIKIIYVTTVAVCLSASIELLQLILHRGFCEIDDLICNVLGALLGTISIKWHISRKIT